MDPDLKEFNENRQGMFDPEVIASQLDPLQMIQLLKDAGWKEAELQRAFEVSFLESKHRPLITHELKNEGDPDVTSIGLFQITEAHAIKAEEKYGKKWRDVLKDPMENAKFALELYNEFGWEPWAAHDRIENLIGNRFRHGLLDADGTLKSTYPPEHYYELGRTKQKGYDNTIKDWNEAKYLYRAASGLPLSPLRDKYKKEADGSYKFYNQTNVAPSDPQAGMFEMYTAQSPEIRSDEQGSVFPTEQEWANTKTQQTSDILAAGTDQIETDRFRPKFMEPKPRGGAIGARQNMVQ